MCILLNILTKTPVTLYSVEENDVGPLFNNGFCDQTISGLREIFFSMNIGKYCCKWVI